MRILVIGLLVLGMSSPALAGVKEKKARKAAMAMAKEKIAKVEKACGTKGLKTNYSLKGWKKPTEGCARSTVEDALMGLEYACKDADYREEIAKLKKVNFVVDASGKMKKHAFKAKGKSMTITLAQCYLINDGREMAKLIHANYE